MPRSAINRGPGAGSGRCCAPERVPEDDGYAAVDALVALMILAATLVCSVSATHGSRLAAAAALELRRANELGVYLVETAPVSPSKTSGQAQGFAWTLEVMDPVNAFGPGAICERRAVLTGLRDQRQFVVRANAVCPSGNPV